MSNETFFGIFKFPHVNSQFPGVLELFHDRNDTEIGKLTVEYIPHDEGFNIYKIRNECNVIHGTLSSGIKTTLVVNYITESLNFKNNFMLWKFTIHIKFVFFIYWS